MTRPRLTPETATALVLCAAGVLVVWLSRDLPYWIDIAPGPGFFPRWLGVLLTIGAWFELFFSVRSSSSAGATARPSAEDASALSRRSAILGAISVASALLVAPLGFVVATGVFVAAASWTLDPARRLTNAAASILIPASVWLLFSVWLGVPLPRGPWGF
jgi:putative tricarboxylic transport membrane protein